MEILFYLSPLIPLSTFVERGKQGVRSFLDADASKITPIWAAITPSEMVAALPLAEHSFTHPEGCGYRIQTDS